MYVRTANLQIRCSLAALDWQPPTPERSLWRDVVTASCQKTAAREWMWSPCFQPLQSPPKDPISSGAVHANCYMTACCMSRLYAYACCGLRTVVVLSDFGVRGAWNRIYDSGKISSQCLGNFFFFIKADVWWHERGVVPTNLRSDFSTWPSFPLFPRASCTLRT